MGEALIDLKPDAVAEGDAARPGQRRLIALPGGSPANTAVALARLGTRARLAARLSNDPFGRMLREHLNANGVDLTYSVSAVQPASLALAALDEQGRAVYSFYLTGTADWQWSVGELPAELPEDVVAVHTGSLALALPPGSAALIDLLRRQRGRRTISIDPNVRPGVVGDRALYSGRVEEWVTLADLVKVSEDDLRWLYPDTDVVTVARRWAASGPAVVVVTMGADGALAVAAGEQVRRPAVPIAVVDTVGAGDSFTAALLDWLARRDLLGAGKLARVSEADLAAALDFAALVAAITCSRSGADPPRRSELEAPIR